RPQLSPVSLHDALPIFHTPDKAPLAALYGAPYHRGRGGRDDEHDGRSAPVSGPCAPSGLHHQGRNQTRKAFISPNFGPYIGSRRDRKSTRLNSSHVKIS